MQTPTLYALDTDVEVMLKTSSKLGEATNASVAVTKARLCLVFGNGALCACTSLSILAALTTGRVAASSSPTAGADIERRRGRWVDTLMLRRAHRTGPFFIPNSRGNISGLFPSTLQ